jgi:ubiquinone/menaquinone biosynthesis C-methylase UbiE
MQVTPDTPLNPVEIFLKSWRLYQEIIEHNYMFHQEITQAVASALQGFSPESHLRILDLGCGDASMALPLIQPACIANYRGCDLSQPALDIARQKLNSRHIPHQLICDDMVRVAAEQADNSIDLVISSYAIHHLNEPQKQQIIRDIARMLPPDGRFVLIDIFREPNEDRAAYMRDYMSHLRSTWRKLSPASQEMVVEHATSYDFPETAEFYQALCLKHGLDAGQRLSKHTWHEAWLFSKSAPMH